MMPGNPKECRENAKQCLQLASAARTQAGRERFEGLAQRWMALANDYEAANLLLANWRFRPRTMHRSLWSRSRPPILNPQHAQALSRPNTSSYTNV